MTRTPSSTPDVLVIGGGVAGGGLATALARAGLDVTVVERTTRFIDRIRGEFVHVWGVREAERTGLLDIALERAGGRLHAYWTKYTDRTPGTPYRWADDFPDALGTLSVSHPALQQALLDAAADAGVTVLRPATLDGVTWAGDAPVVAIRQGSETLTLRPRLLVGADGAHSLVRRALGGQRIADPQHHAIGGAVIRGIDLPEDSAHRAYFPGGFTMIFPQGDGLSRVYYVCSTEEASRLQRAEQPATLIARLREVLPEGTMDRATGTDAPVGFFPNAGSIASVACGPRTVLVGDAIGTNDPSQGHGLSLIFRDVHDLTERLTGSDDWTNIPTAFAERRGHDQGVLRAHAQWVAPLSTETGPHIDALRAQIDRARAVDPTAGGFAGIFATGPARLDATEEARRRFLGEEIPAAD